MISKIQVPFSDQELSALRTVAEQEYRDIRSQIAFIVRSDLQRRGLLPASRNSTIIQSGEPTGESN